MELSITEQGLVFLFSCAVGVFLGAFYDIFRIIRIAFNSRWLSIFFQDFIFCIFSAVSIILLVFYTNSGVVRWFALFGCFLCFLLYHLTVGRFIMFMARKIIDFISRVLNFIKSVTVVPAVRLALFVFKTLKQLGRQAKRESYYSRQKNKARREASRGFGLYKYKKVPAAVSRGVAAEIKKQGRLDKAQAKQERAAPQPYKKSGGKARTLGSLGSLSEIKFK